MKRFKEFCESAVNNISAREIVKKHLKPNGWLLKSTSGSHDVYEHPARKEKIAVPRHTGDLAPGTSRSIIKTVKS